MKRVIMSGRLPVKLWLDYLEDEAEQQAVNLANHPFAVKHVAVMPDAHAGYGMPIGGVLATREVVIPNAVGVDIGCFTGETKVPLLNGTQKTLAELAVNDSVFWVYSMDKRGNVVPGRAIARKTRTMAPLVRIVITGGEQIICTPDHLFMLKDGTYRSADSLVVLDSLMPLYRSYPRDGREFITTKNGKTQLTHRMVGNYIYGTQPDGWVFHHADENPWNNTPENLIPMSSREHSAHPHSRKTDLRSEEFKRKRMVSLRKNGFYASHLKKKKHDVAVENITRYMKEQPEKFASAIAGNGQRGKAYLTAYNLSERGREKSKEVANRLYLCEVCGLSVKSPIGLYNHKKKEHGNHKVLVVEPLDYCADVYCLSVEEHHNFALAAGVFVHNCGMSAVKTSLNEIDTEALKQVMGLIRKRIPLGFNRHQDAQPWQRFDDAPDVPIIQRELASSRYQLGTLGGGNHFIELQRGSDDHIWYMVHSGSRNFGLKVASEYHKKAVALCERWASDVPHKDLSFLPMDTPEGREYIAAMNYCLEFAARNRWEMMQRIGEALTEVMPFYRLDDIDIHHNYAAMENHFGANVLVHRKGATKAVEGGRGIIPGSMGTSSYITRGLGNPESFNSSSHGAGRRMSRSKAKEKLALAEEQARMEGIVHGLRNVSDLDEAPGAYKDVEEVMENQKDLVEVAVTLRPLASIKG